MTRLWKDFDGEPFLINPHLITLNPGRAGRRRASKMARKRNARGRFVKSNPVRRHRRSPARRKRATPRRNAYFMNAPKRHRRRAVRMNPPGRHHRRIRRNPPLFGGNRILGMSVNEILYAGAGFIAPPFLEGLIKPYLPATFISSDIGKYALKAGVVAGVSFAGSKFLGREAGKYLAIGGITYIVANLLTQYVPQLVSGVTFSGYMNPGTTYNPRAVRPMGAQPFLGMYQGSQSRVPERLQVGSRF